MSNLFFSIQDVDARHTDQYVIDFLKKQMLHKGGMLIDDAYSLVQEQFNDVRLNRVRFRKLARENFLNDKKFIWLSEEQKRNAFQSSRVNAQLNKYILYTEKDLQFQLSEYLHEGISDLLNACLIVYAENIKSGRMTKDQAAELYADLSNNKNQYLDRISNALKTINPTVKDSECSAFFNDDYIVNLLDSYSIHTINDLTNCSAEMVLLIICTNPVTTIADLERLAGDIDANYLKKLDAFLRSHLKSRELEILSDRNGFTNGKPMTLEEIGEKDSITRERVRQIESIGKRKIAQSLNGIKKEIDFICRYHLAGMNRQAIGVEDFANEIGDAVAARETVFLLEQDYYENTGYSQEYQIIFDSSVTDEKEIKENIINRFGDYITQEQVDAEPAYIRRIIDQDYHIPGKNNRIYLLKGMRLTDIYVSVIRKTFPDGYRTYDDEDYQKFAETFKDLIGNAAEIPTQAAIRGAVNRTEFTQVDRGTYKVTDDCQKMPNALLNDIVDFIIDHLPMVDYRTIYDAFSDRLKEIGIDNNFYLKGVLDPELPDGIITKRNYVTEEDNRVTAVEARLKYIHSFEGPFTIADLRKRFPGVKDYTFTQLFYDESKNGLLAIDNGMYLYADKIPFDPQKHNELKVIIDEIFENSGSTVLNTRKIYARIRIQYPDILQGLKYIKSQFALFSFINYEFANDYYFSRPWISTEENNEMSVQGILYGYLRSRDSFTYRDIKSYILKMNIRFNDSYINVIEDLSDQFVLINSHAVVSKEKFGISDRELNDIKQTLELALKQNKEISTENFAGYQMFPELAYPWNKFMLAGVVRSFFDELYEVTHQFNTHSEALDFQIRRLENEQ